MINLTELDKSILDKASNNMEDSWFTRLPVEDKIKFTEEYPESSFSEEFLASVEREIEDSTTETKIAQLDSYLLSVWNALDESKKAFLSREGHVPFSEDRKIYATFLRNNGVSSSLMLCNDNEMWVLFKRGSRQLVEGKRVVNPQRTILVSVVLEVMKYIYEMRQSVMSGCLCYLYLDILNLLDFSKYNLKESNELELDEMDEVDDITEGDEYQDDEVLEYQATSKVNKEDEIRKVITFWEEFATVVESHDFSNKDWKEALSIDISINEQVKKRFEV